MNAQIIRKFNNKKQAHNLKAFEAAYQKIQISSKRCYVATMCFGFNHSKTEELRHFKLSIAEYELGKDFIDFYYRFSPSLVSFLETKPKSQAVFNLMAKPVLSTFIFLVRPYVHYKKTHS